MSNFIPKFVFSADMQQHARTVEGFVKAEVRRTRRTNLGWRVYGLSMTGLVILLGGTLNYALPLKQIAPVYFYVRQDGVVETATTPDALPVELKDAALKAWLWQYVQRRESYSWAEAEYNHYVVSAMSSVPVRAAYDQWASGKNPHSYLAVYGKRGVVRVSLREIQLDKDPNGDGGKVIIHFDRQVAIEGEHPQPVETWSVAMTFVQNYNFGLNIRDILQFNPGRIVITSYPAPQPLPAVSGGIQGAHP